jgi:hypothetical protein
LRQRRPTPPQEEEQPEFVAFCNQIEGEELHCYDTFEDCVDGEEFIGDEDPECRGVETRPPDAGDCFVLRDEEGVVDTLTCNFI